MWLARLAQFSGAPKDSCTTALNAMIGVGMTHVRDSMDHTQSGSEIARRQGNSVEPIQRLTSAGRGGSTAHDPVEDKYDKSTHTWSSGLYIFLVIDLRH